MATNRCEDDGNNFNLQHKNPAMRPSASFNEIYVTRRHPLAVYFKRASHLVKDSSSEIIKIHGLGVCVAAAVWLVQDILSQFSPLVEIQNTEIRTVPVVDDGLGAKDEVIQLITFTKFVKRLGLQAMMPTILSTASCVLF